MKLRKKKAKSGIGGVSRKNKSRQKSGVEDVTVSHDPECLVELRLNHILPNFGRLIVACTKSDYRCKKIISEIDAKMITEAGVFMNCLTEEIGVKTGVQMSRQSRRKYHESLNNISDRTIRSLLRNLKGNVGEQVFIECLETISMREMEYNEDKSKGTKHIIVSTNDMKRNNKKRNSTNRNDRKIAQTRKSQRIIGKRTSGSKITPSSNLDHSINNKRISKLKKQE